MVKKFQNVLNFELVIISKISGMLIASASFKVKNLSICDWFSFAKISQNIGFGSSLVENSEKIIIFSKLFEAF